MAVEFVDLKNKIIEKKPRTRSKLVHGLGINDAPYQTTYNNGLFDSDGNCIYPPGWVCPAVQVWRGMIKRCVSIRFKNKYPTYNECYLNDEWIRFSGFLRWYDKNFVEGYHLDKDILIPGNKEYGPNTCCFVPAYINTLVVGWDFESGVRYMTDKGLKNRYYAKLSIHGKSTSLGLYATEALAREAWRKAKADYIFACVNMYSKEPEGFRSDVAEALTKIAKELLESNVSGNGATN